MKQGISQISFAVKEPRNYMVVELEEGADLQEFCMTMAERNIIPGLLPVSRQFDNGTDVLYYEITGKKRISSVLNPEQKDEAVLLILNYLVDTLKGLPEYFLHSTQCLLDAEYIFVDRHLQVGFALVPMQSDPEDGSSQLRTLFMELLALCTSDGNQNKLAPVLTYLIHPDFSLEEFSQILSGLTRKSAPRPITAGMPGNQPMHEIPVVKPQPDLPGRSDAPAAREPAKGAGIVLPGFDRAKEKGRDAGSSGGASATPGFAIPGGGQVAVPDPKKPPKEPKAPKAPKPEKKSLFSFGKKKAEEVQMNEEAHVISGGVPTPPAGPVKRDQWKGTVSFEDFDSGETEFMGSDSADAGDVLIYQGRSIPLDQMPFTIGRFGCSFLINSPKISKHHVTIWRKNNEYYVQDENSLNQTYINGLMLRPLSPTVLPDGAELRLGNERFTLRLGK